MSGQGLPTLFDWWRALEAAPLRDGAHKTAMVWARNQWWWDGKLSEAEVLRQVDRLRLEEFGARYRPGRGLSTLRRDFADLLDAGLLQVHRRRSRWGPTVYVPRLPAALNTEASDENSHGTDDVLSAQQQALKTPNSAHERALLDPLSARNRAQERSIPSAPLFSPEPALEGPPSPLPVIPATPWGGTTGQGGGRTSEEERERRIDDALDEIHRLVPMPHRQRLHEPSWRQDLEPLVGAALDDGWLARELAQQVTKDRWGDVHTPVGVLRARLRNLPIRERSAPPPEAAGISADQKSSRLAAIALRRAAVEEERRSSVPAPDGIRDILRRPRSSHTAPASTQVEGVDVDGASGPGEGHLQRDRQEASA